MKRFQSKLAIKVVCLAALTLLAAGCGQASPPASPAPSPAPTTAASPLPTVPAPSPTATAAAVTPTSIPAPATVAPTPASTGGTPTPEVKLVTENFEFTVLVNEDDLDPILPAIRGLTGVTDVEEGGNSLQITYDPSQVSHKQIVDTIQGYGLHVKE